MLRVSRDESMARNRVTRAIDPKALKRDGIRIPAYFDPAQVHRGEGAGGVMIRGFDVKRRGETGRENEWKQAHKQAKRKERKKIERDREIER